MASLNNALADDQALNLATTFATATMTLYDGTVPANADTPLVAGNNVIVTHTLAGLNANGSGVLTANVIADETIALNGDVTFARLSNGTETMQLTVGTTGTEVTVTSIGFVQNNTSVINSLVITQPKS